MKLKLFFRMLLCSAALLSFAACSDDDDDAPFIDDGVICYVGAVSVDQNDGTVFKDNNVKIDLTFYPESETATMVVNQVKFAEEMPIRLDMTVKGLAFSQVGSSISLAGSGIVPEAMGGPFPAYTITKFNGVATGEQFSFEMMCGTYPVSFVGKASLSSSN